MEGFSPSNIWPKDYRGYMSSAPRKNQIYHQKILRHATIYILCWRHGSKRLNQLIYIVCFCLDIWLQMYWWSITLVMDRSLFSCLKLHFCFVIHLKKKKDPDLKRGGETSRLASQNASFSELMSEKKLNKLCDTATWNLKAISLPPVEKVTRLPLKIAWFCELLSLQELYILCETLSMINSWLFGPSCKFGKCYTSSSSFLCVKNIMSVCTSDVRVYYRCELTQDRC